MPLHESQRLAGTLWSDFFLHFEDPDFAKGIFLFLKAIISCRRAGLSNRIVSNHSQGTNKTREDVSRSTI